MRDGGGSGTVQELEDPEPNAYERRPGKGKGKRSTNGKRLGGPGASFEYSTSPSSQAYRTVLVKDH